MHLYGRDFIFFDGLNERSKLSNFQLLSSEIQANNLNVTNSFDFHELFHILS